MEADPSGRLLTDWFQPPRVGEGRRGASRSFLSRDGRAHLDNRFAEIAAFEHAAKRLGRIGKTLGDILPALDAPVGDPAADLFEKLGALMPALADDEPAHSHAAGQIGAARPAEGMRPHRPN